MSGYSTVNLPLPPTWPERLKIPGLVGGTALTTLAATLGLQHLLKKREEEMRPPLDLAKLSSYAGELHPADKIASQAYQDACSLMKLSAGPGLLAKGLDLARRAAPSIQGAAQKGINWMKAKPNAAIMAGGTALGAVQGVANRQEGQGLLNAAGGGALRGAAVTGLGLGALRGAQRLPGMLGPRTATPGLVPAGVMV